jgi:hypothetical protein
MRCFGVNHALPDPALDKIQSRLISNAAGLLLVERLLKGGQAGRNQLRVIRASRQWIAQQPLLFFPIWE